MKEPTIILEDWSPVCNINAFVEKSDTCCYFYLWMNPGTENPLVKSCWICNVGTAPEEIDVEAMKSGAAPAMPGQYISHNPEGMDLQPEALQIVWFEEGDAAALLYNEEIICVIPGWSGYEGFCGYSKYAKGTTPYAWELTNALETMEQRVQKSKVFWQQFEQDYWGDVQENHLNSLEKFFGKHEKYYAIDGGEFPPKALIKGRKGSIIYGITAGASLIPMPAVEQYFGEETKEYRRIELGFAAIEQHEALCDIMYSYLSVWSAFPWKQITFLAHGHTIPFNSIKGFSAILFINPRLVPDIEMPEYEERMDEKINLLWAVPVTKIEYEFMLEHDISETLNHVKGEISKIHIFDGTSKFQL